MIQHLLDTHCLYQLGNCDCFYLFVLFTVVTEVQFKIQLFA